MVSKVKAHHRRGIQSVGIGMRVLSAVAAMTGPASLSAIAAKSNMSASKAHRYLSSLVASTVLRQDPHTGHYDLAAGAIRIGLAALSRNDAFSNAIPFVDALVQRTGRTATLNIFGDAGPTVLRWFMGHPAVVTSLAIGSTLPLLRSATGQVFFAFGHKPEVDEFARREIASFPGDYTADLEALRAEVAARCLAVNTGELTPGLRVAAGPVFDLQGRLVLVIALLASAYFPAAQDEESYGLLLDTCRAITESLGGRWPDGKRVRETLNALHKAKTVPRRTRSNVAPRSG